MRVELFDFHLPPALIAMRPANPRDKARLLCIKPGLGTAYKDYGMRDLPLLLRSGDALILNDTKVFPAELSGLRKRGGSDAHVTFNLHKRIDERTWRTFARPAKKLQAGDEIVFDSLAAHVVERHEAEVVLQFSKFGQALDEAIAAEGVVPLPPYIASKRPADAQDVQDYQTLYARYQGSVAAPTAGLHFTPALFAELQKRNISMHYITLHVGAGTFLPVKSDDTEDHVMYPEWGEVSEDTAQALNEVHAKGGRLIPVGTTSLRLIESASDGDGGIRAFAGETALFITPGYRFKVADALLTNFHLPRSTLFMLVSAFSGRETMLDAYRHAVESGYRFYSYGDACLLFPDS